MVMVNLQKTDRHCSVLFIKVTWIIGSVTSVIPYLLTWVCTAIVNVHTYTHTYIPTHKITSRLPSSYRSSTTATCWTCLWWFIQSSRSFWGRRFELGQLDLFLWSAGRFWVYHTASLLYMFALFILAGTAKITTLVTRVWYIHSQRGWW